MKILEGFLMGLLITAIGALTLLMVGIFGAILLFILAMLYQLALTVGWAVSIGAILLCLFVGVGVLILSEKLW